MDTTSDLKQPRPISSASLATVQLDLEQLEKQACPPWERLATHRGELAAEDRAALGAAGVGRFYLLRVRRYQAELKIQCEFAPNVTDLTSELKQCRKQLGGNHDSQDAISSCQKLSNQLTEALLHDIKLIPKIGIDCWIRPLSGDPHRVEKLVKGIVHLLEATTYQQAQKAWGMLIPLWSFKSPLTQQQWSSRRLEATEAITEALALLAEPYRKHELQERCWQLQNRLEQLELEQAQAIAKCRETFCNRVKALLEQ